MHWVACPDILMPSRKVWIACNFLSLRSPFVFKILGSWESSFIKHPVIIKIFCWVSWSFITVLLIEENTEEKTIELTSFAWADLQLFDSVTLFNRNLSTVSGRVSLKATDTTLVTSSGAGSPQFLLAWLWDSENSLKTEPIMGSSYGLPVVVTEENEVSWWDGKEAATSISL